jgi:MFS family permease
MANMMQNIVLAWYIYQITRHTGKSPLYLGGIGLAEAIPAIGLSLYGGYISDQHEKRSLLVRGFMVYVFISLGLLLITSSEIAQHLHFKTQLLFIYLGLFGVGVVRSFTTPASFSILPMIVPYQKLTKASAMSSSSWQIGAVVGPALGGLLLAKIGITNTFICIFSLTLAGWFAAYLLTEKPAIQRVVEEKETIWASIQEGLKFVLDNKIILAALSLDLFAVLFGDATGVFPLFAEEIFKTGEEGLGYLRTAFSLGSVFVLLWLSRKPPVFHTGIKLLLCVAGFGVAKILFATSSNFYFALCFLFLAGMFDGVSVVIRGTILQLYTPDTMRGRVSAVNSMFISSSNEIGALVSGFSAYLFGTVQSVIIGGTLTLFVVLTAYLFAPKLRKLSLEEAN